MPLGPSQAYIVTYNGYQLPGYVQEESANFEFGVATSPIPFSYDGGVHQFAGIHNKTLSLRMKVWEQDHQTCKTEIAKANTYLSSKRNSSGKLYVGYTDRYLWAMPKFVRRQADAASSVRTLEYEVEFDCRPYYIGDDIISVSGYSLNTSWTLNTDIQYEYWNPKYPPDTPVGARDLDEGTWTPTKILVNGTNITISGYLADGTPTGYISVSGSAYNLLIDSETYEATINGVNRNDLMKWADYQTYVGPGKTYFAITNESGYASRVVIHYNRRWAL